jgi:hypothetical protein
MGTLPSWPHHAIAEHDAFPASGAFYEDGRDRGPEQKETVFRKDQDASRYGDRRHGIPLPSVQLALKAVGTFHHRSQP